jgi:hypothetical protein
MKPVLSSRRITAPGAVRQQGTVLLFCLIALVIMLLGSVALVRSFQSSLFTAGNIGFKRDMRNQSEMAAFVALNHFRGSGLLSSAANRAANVAAANYSAVMLPTNEQGIPTVLAATDATFTASNSAPDVTSPDGSVTIRYVIDRMCSAAGNETALSSVSCVLAGNTAAPGGSKLDDRNAETAGLAPGVSSAVPQNVVYRVTMRVTGPRNTLSFFQSTLTVPSS